MSDVTITVIGAGAVGTSLGLALQQLEDSPQLIGHDKDPLHTKQAVKMGAFDKSNWNLINACADADLIVLAIPANEIESTLTAIANDLKEDAIVSDTAQTKADIIKMAESILPKHVHFVGGNPIVSPAGNGPAYARADLFQDTLYCLTPSPSVVPEAIKLLEDMVTLIGGTPFYLDPLEHDGLVCGVNDLPALLSIALTHTVSEPQAWQEARKLAGALFSQVSTGATGDPDALAATFLNNRNNLTRWIDTTIQTLQTAKSLLEEGEAEALAQFVDRAVVARTNWQKDFEANALSNLHATGKETVEKPNLFKQLLGFGNR